MRSWAETYLGFDISDLRVVGVRRCPWDGEPCHRRLEWDDSDCMAVWRTVVDENVVGADSVTFVPEVLKVEVRPVCPRYNGEPLHTLDAW